MADSIQMAFPIVAAATPTTSRDRVARIRLRQLTFRAARSGGGAGSGLRRGVRFRRGAGGGGAGLAGAVPRGSGGGAGRGGEGRAGRAGIAARGGGAGGAGRAMAEGWCNGGRGGSCGRGGRGRRGGNGGSGRWPYCRGGGMGRGVSRRITGFGSGRSLSRGIGGGATRGIGTVGGSEAGRRCSLTRTIYAYPGESPEPTHVPGQHDVADEGDRVDQSVGDHQRP